jgi:hypothetical protein
LATAVGRSPDRDTLRRQPTQISLQDIAGHVVRISAAWTRLHGRGQGRTPRAHCAGSGPGRGGGPDGLRAVLIEAAELLHGHPRDEKLFRAVDRTYLRPAPTQERAAELLGLPFSTYRRHRRDGLDRIVETLWVGEPGRT